MTFDLTQFFVPGLLLVAMAASVAFLAIYRFFVAKGQDYHLHAVAEEAAMATHQTELARRLDRVDRWGKLLTTVTVAYAVILAAIFFYLEFQARAQIRY